MADINGNGNGKLPWQSITNWLFAALISVGAYVWNETVADLKHEQQTNQQQNEKLMQLVTQREAQEWRNNEMQRQLGEMNDKLDRLLREPRVSAQPSFR